MIPITDFFDKCGPIRIFIEISSYILNNPLNKTYFYFQNQWPGGVPLKKFFWKIWQNLEWNHLYRSYLFLKKELRVFPVNFMICSRKAFLPNTELHLETNQLSKMKLLAKMVNGCVKSFILDIWLVSEWASGTPANNDAVCYALLTHFMPLIRRYQKRSVAWNGLTSFGQKFLKTFSD